METKFMSKWILIIVYFFSFLNIQAKASPPYPELKLQIKADKENLVLGEPLILDANIVNLSDTPVKFIMGGPPEIFVSKDGLSFLQYRDSNIVAAYEPVLVELRPNEIKNLGKSKVLYYISETREKIIFDVPCEYFVKAKYYVTPHNTKQHITLESSVVKIKVVEPVGSDRKVWNIIASDIEFVRFIHHGYTSKQSEDEVIRTLKQIIETYPTSTYTPYIKEALIKYYRTKRNMTDEEKEYLKTLQKN